METKQKINEMYSEILNENAEIPAILATIGIFAFLPLIYQELMIAKACRGEEGIDNDICRLRFKRSKINEDVLKLENKIATLKIKKNKIDIKIEKLLREKQKRTGTSQFRKK